MKLFVVSAVLVSLQVLGASGEQHHRLESMLSDDLYNVNRALPGEDTEGLEFDDDNFDFKPAGPGYSGQLREFQFKFEESSELELIGFDLSEMQEYLPTSKNQRGGPSEKAEEHLAISRRIYEEGGYSKPMAILHLNSPLETDLERFSPVEGVTVEGLAVNGTLLVKAPVGTTAIKIVYDRTIDERRHWMDNFLCSVGGLPFPNIEGCFAALGTVQIGRTGATTTTLAYEYDPSTENSNLQTLQGLSTKANANYWNCTNCPYTMFRKYQEYYGYSDYADQWIQAWMADESTKLLRGNRPKGISERHGSNTIGARAEAVKTAVLVMSMWMAVIGQLEKALDSCREFPNHEGNSRAIRELEKGAALYLHSFDVRPAVFDKESLFSRPQRNVVCLYDLADDLCKDFETCGGFPEGRAWVNYEVVNQLDATSADLSNGRCQKAREGVEHIEKHMAIPLLQGMIKNVYMTSFALTEPGCDNESCISPDEAWGRAEAFTAALLPLVNHCDIDLADKLHKHVFSSSIPEWKSLREVIISVIACLNISSKELGGLWKPREKTDHDYGPEFYYEGHFYKGAEPFDTPDNKLSGPKRALLIVGVVVFAVVAVGNVYVLLKYKYALSKDDEHTEEQIELKSFGMKTAESNARDAESGEEEKLC